MNRRRRKSQIEKLLSIWHNVGECAQSPIVTRRIRKAKRKRSIIAIPKSRSMKRRTSTIDNRQLRTLDRGMSQARR